MTVNYLKSRLRNPSSYIENKIYYWSVKDNSFVMVEVDYSEMNGLGGYNRGTCTGTCEKGMIR